MLLTALSQQGYYTPTPFANLTSQPSKNVTFCSNQTSFFHFDPAAVIQNELKSGVKLTDLKWPSAIEDGVHAVKGAMDLVFILFFTAAITTGVALLAALVAVRTVGRYSAISSLITLSVCHPRVFAKAGDLAKELIANFLVRFRLSSPCFIHLDHRDR